MISLSIYFHIFSFIAFAILGFLFVKSQANLKFLREWYKPNQRAFVGRIDAGILAFCQSLGIKLNCNTKHPLPVAKVSLSALFELHSANEIMMIEILDNQKTTIYIRVKDTVLPENKVEIAKIAIELNVDIQIQQWSQA